MIILLSLHFLSFCLFDFLRVIQLRLDIYAYVPSEIACGGATQPSSTIQRAGHCVGVQSLRHLCCCVMLLDASISDIYYAHNYANLSLS